MTDTPSAPPGGALVISLDFELHWGVRDRYPSIEDCAHRLLGARAAVPILLELFEEYRIAATWATVGFLFAGSRRELERFQPIVRPSYRRAELSPYGEPVGSNETDDPLHLAASLLEQIRHTPRQEIATHTFSHYFCGEEGQDAASFRADLDAARAIAGARGVALRSIVFPRNQHNPDYDEILIDGGITAYRGNPRSWMWRFSDSEESGSAWKRAARMADAYVALTGGCTTAWSDVIQSTGLSDVRASFFLRPFHARLAPLEPLRLRRFCRSMRHAARTGRILHLWWHPHNFGTHLQENVNFLRRLLEEFTKCRERYGMRSLTMQDVDVAARTAADRDHAPEQLHQPVTSA